VRRNGHCDNLCIGARHEKVPSPYLRSPQATKMFKGRSERLGITGTTYSRVDEVKYQVPMIVLDLDLLLFAKQGCVGLQGYACRARVDDIAIRNLRLSVSN
jgi:hypothetical protein